MGYHRAEIFGAFTSIIIIWGLLIWLNTEAIYRINNPPEEINAIVMVITSCIGLTCNIINICQLNYEEFGEDEDEEGDMEISSIEASIRSYSSNP